MMNYWKLFLPVPIAIALTSTVPFLEISYPEYSRLAGVCITGSILLYYLRVENSDTPLINTLTLTLLINLVGQYFIKDNHTLGITLIIIGNLAFVMTFVFRQRLKATKDKNVGIKAFAVFVFGLSMVISFVAGKPWILAIGNLALTGVYFYDRLIQISERSNHRQ